MKKYFYILIALCAFWIPTQVDGATFYVDFSSTTPSCVGGTSTTTSWNNLHCFTENARTAGDIAFVRRGQATTTGITDITFLSDGNLNNPITITADYDNLWSDFATSSQTYTPVFGTKTMEASASITGIAANDWIYVAGDCYEIYNNQNLNPCEYAYEVASVSGTTLTLYLPYKGTKSGSGNDLRVMPDAPIWGTTASDFQWTATTDTFWKLAGLEIRSTDASCALSVAQSSWVVRDMIFQGDGTTACGLGFLGAPHGAYKMRTYNTNSGGVGRLSSGAWVKDVLVDCNNAVSASGLGASDMSFVINAEIVQCTTDIAIAATTNILTSPERFQNIKFASIGLSNLSGRLPVDLYFEDPYGIPGLNFTSSNKVDTSSATTTTSTTTTLRSGGGTKNQLIAPPTGTGNSGISTKQFPFSYIKLFEYPIYADTSSKTYTAWFNSTTTNHWTTDPLTATATGSSTPELYIECEYYNDATDADRFLKRSNTANDVDFNGSTSWQDISITCQPTQAGVLYLRGWYAKPVETGKSNWFLMDTKIDIQ